MVGDEDAVVGAPASLCEVGLELVLSKVSPAGLVDEVRVVLDPARLSVEAREETLVPSVTYAQ